MQIRIVNNGYQKRITFECNNGLVLTFEKGGHPFIDDINIASVEGLEADKIIMAKKLGRPEEVNDRIFTPKITTGGVVIFATKKSKARRKPHDNRNNQ